ncbi:MAG: hypothetical protein U0T81_14615 [Saprospiraceae bacterium]
MLVQDQVDMLLGINVDYNNGALSCNNNIQISLDQNCLATVTPEMVLEGTYNPGCLGDFQVVVKDWNTNAVIDLDPNTPYPQIGVAQIDVSSELRSLTSYRNSCWGSATLKTTALRLFIVFLTFACLAQIIQTQLHLVFRRLRKDVDLLL